MTLAPGVALLAASINYKPPAETINLPVSPGSAQHRALQCAEPRGHSHKGVPFVHASRGMKARTARIFATRRRSTDGAGVSFRRVPSFRGAPSLQCRAPVKPVTGAAWRLAVRGCRCASRDL